MACAAKGDDATNWSGAPDRAFGHGGAYGTKAWIDPKQNLFVVLVIQRGNLPNSDNALMRKALQAAAVEPLKR
jgi:CubicO group peptidase (beta-lactamase class C family)